MMCREFEGLIEAHLVGMMHDEGAREFQEHLRICPDCAEKLRQAEGLLEETGSALKWAMPDSNAADRVVEHVAASAIHPRRGWGDFVREQFDRAPWWMISAVVHAVILMLMTIISVTNITPPREEVVIVTTLSPEKPVEYTKQRKFDIFEHPQEIPGDVVVESPVFVTEPVDDIEDFNTENEFENTNNKPHGQEDAISDIPLSQTGLVGVIGPGGGGAGCFGYRTGRGKLRALGSGGGTRASESSVNAALEWLARHQEPDGHWDTRKYEGTGDFDVAMTGFAGLAFLGAGHTERAGKYRVHIAGAIKWLRDHQKADGSFGTRNMYQHAIASLCLAEAYGMARNPKTGVAAQKAIDFIEEAQHEYMAWNYGPDKDPNGRNDTSVTGWQIMALKSAKVAGLKIDGTCFQGAVAWLDIAQDLKGAPEHDSSLEWEGGKTAYSGTKGNVNAGQGSMAMCAAGCLMRQFMGWKSTDPSVYGPANVMMRNLPDWDRAPNMYYWYYGTLCMFQQGGKWWKAWNGALRDMLIEHQRKDGDERGSWDPVHSYTKRGGRVMSTALGALCLEVYYRYMRVTK